MRAKVGEFYRHKWNKYVSKVTEVKRDKIELKTLNSGVTEYIHKDNFDANYEPCVTIYQWRKTLEDIYGEVQLIGDTVRVQSDTTIIDFSIDRENRLTVCFTDDIKEAINSETNIMRFLLEDADEVISMFANFI